MLSSKRVAGRLLVRHNIRTTVIEMDRVYRMNVLKKTLSRLSQIGQSAFTCQILTSQCAGCESLPSAVLYPVLLGSTNDSFCRCAQKISKGSPRSTARSWSWRWSSNTAHSFLCLVSNTTTKLRTSVCQSPTTCLLSV